MLCKGYSVPSYQTLEDLYAVLPSGDVFVCADLPASVHFDHPGRVWKQVAVLPEGAEFIGHYEFPKMLMREEVACG